MGWSSKWDEWVSSEEVSLLKQYEDALNKENYILYTKKTGSSESDTKDILSNQKLSTFFVNSSKFNLRIGCKEGLPNS